MQAAALPDDTRSRLIEAAGEVFAEFGFQRATVREICARAGVNIALVNYYFGDKQELYSEVLRRSMGAPHGKITTALQTPAPPEEVIRQTIRAMLHHIFGADRPAWHFRLLAHEMAQPTPAISVVIDETARPVYDGIRAAVGAIIGLPRDDDRTRMAAHSIIAQVVHYSHGRNMCRQLWPALVMTPERIEQIADHIAAFSLAGLEQMKKGLPAPAASRKAHAHNTPRKKT
jgi:AcrR family transcriptional regulator